MTRSFASSPSGHGRRLLEYAIMKCDKCGAEATIHDLKLSKGGITSQVHLCEKCAAELGMVGKSFKSIEELLAEAIKGHHPTAAKSSTALVRRTPGATCGTCGLTWSDFRDKGVLGCPDCYAAFASRITPLLGRAHEGGTHHVGKVPRRFKDKADIEPKVRHLRKQLAEALLTEQYERAARLRDQLVALGMTTTGERLSADAPAPMAPRITTADSHVLDGDAETDPPPLAPGGGEGGASGGSARRRAADKPTGEGHSEGGEGGPSS